MKQTKTKLSLQNYFGVLVSRSYIVFVVRCLSFRGLSFRLPEILHFLNFLPSLEILHWRITKWLGFSAIGEDVYRTMAETA